MWLLAVDKAAYEAGLIRPRADKYAQTIYIERVLQGEPIGRFEVVRLIFQLAITGLGKRAIAKRLNDRCIPAFRGRNGWHHSSVQRILQNPPSSVTTRHTPAISTMRVFGTMRKPGR